MPAKKPLKKPDVQLKPWQVEGVRLMVSKPAAGLFMDPGLGKTLTTLAAFDTLRAAGVVKTMLVVAPLRPAYEVWQPEIEKWGFDFTSEILHGRKKEQRLRQKADVFVINYEGLEWLLATLKKERWTFDMVVFDESSMLRNTRTKRFQMLRASLNLFKRRYLLTGTPAPKGLENLFGQIYVLDGGKALGAFVTHFRREFFDQDPYAPFPRYVLKPGAAERIYERVAPLVYRADESVLDLPALVRAPDGGPLVRYVTLPRGARLVYDDLERDLITQIEDKVIYAKSAGVATQKLRQVANGGLYLSETEVIADGHNRSYKELHPAKTDAVLELLDELEGKPTLIAYEFHHDRNRLLHALGPDTPWVGGGTTPKRVRELREAWNRGEIEKMLVQPASVAFGLNLQAGGRALIWHSLVWNYEHYDQLIRRIYRQGQRHRVYVYHVVARATTDEAILETMALRRETQGDLFTALKSYLKRRTS